jgi:malate dehydrogenase (oxaloacetate-decarboxylating)
MKQQEYKLIRTLRCKDVNLPGVLGRLATAVGDAGGNIGNVRTIHLGHNYIVRDLDVFVDDESHLERVLKSIAEVPDIELLEVRDEVLELHHDGKIKMVSSVHVNSVEMLRRIYTPGVADVCRKLQKDPSLKYLYTSISTSVAIVTDGSRVLGLGDIGAVAGMPVMEGKAALLEQLVGLSGIPILLDTHDTEETINAVKHISITFGGIQLEDIASPRCFEVYTRLRDELDIPVMHDDQQGTAVVATAAAVNACRIAGIDINRAVIGQIGLGAAGLSIAEMLFKYTGNPVLGTARTEASLERHRARGGIASNLPEIMKKADIVIGCSGVKGLIPPESVRRGQVILALTNPEPEIEPAAALSCGAAVAADGKSVNNLLGFPGIWRGTLDSRASRINEQMLLAAALVVAEQAPQGELMPAPLDLKVHRAVSQAVAKAAMESGVAQQALDEDYFESLETGWSIDPPLNAA